MFIFVFLVQTDDSEVKASRPKRFYMSGVTSLQDLDSVIELSEQIPGLRPPVPTELVSVFYLKTGSVQQEQEWSPLPLTVLQHQLSLSLQGGPAHVQLLR